MKRALLLIALVGCGKTEPTSPPTTKTIASIDAAHFENKAKREEAAKTPATKPAPVEPDRTPIGTFDAMDLWVQYRTNQLTADKKYAGKYVTINGSYGDAGKDRKGDYFFGIRHVNARADNQPALKFVISKSAEDDFAKLMNWTKIKVTAKVIGRVNHFNAFEGFFVEFHDAVLVTPDRQDSEKANP